jgi:glutamine amidotransferase
MSDRDVVVVDYGMGNLRSVANAVASVGGAARISDRPAEIEAARRIILPGVGAFRAGMEGLDRLGLIEPLRRRARAGAPLLGICLGMQLLFPRGDEGGETEGLGVIQGLIKRFANTNGNGHLKVPHMGWNQITTGHKTQDTRHRCPLLKNVPDGAFMYFVHSYYPEPFEASVIAARTIYGVEFASMIWQGAVAATQFHPEKSQRLGLQLLQNFLEWTC